MPNANIRLIISSFDSFSNPRLVAVLTIPIDRQYQPCTQVINRNKIQLSLDLADIEASPQLSVWAARVPPYLAAESRHLRKISTTSLMLDSMPDDIFINCGISYRSIARNRHSATSAA